MVTTASVGATMAISITPEFNNSQGFTEAFQVWIDYNQDGDFGDAGESVFEQLSSSTANGSITIPATASIGTTRMRVSMKWGSYAEGSCGEYNYGEVEDYTVQIVGQSIVAARLEDSDSSKAPEMYLFPNPMTNHLNVQLDQRIEKGRLEIYDNLGQVLFTKYIDCLLYTSPSPRDLSTSRMPSSA